MTDFSAKIMVSEFKGPDAPYTDDSVSFCVYATRSAMFTFVPSFQSFKGRFQRGLSNEAVLVRFQGTRVVRAHTHDMQETQ